MSIKSKFLVYSGTYNPIHNGHLHAAQKAKEMLGCEKVVLIPAQKPYHKSIDTLASFEDRVNMAKLAVENLDGFEVSDIDKEANPENSYSFNTINKLIEKMGINKGVEKINFLIGSDAFEKLNKWFKVDELVKLVDFIVVVRPNTLSVEDIAVNLKKFIPNLTYKVMKDATDMSSTFIRNNIKAGRDVINCLPAKVLEYITKNKLYK